MMKGNIGECQDRIIEFAPAFHEALDKSIPGEPHEPDHPQRNCAMEAYSQAVKTLDIKDHKDPAIVAGFAGGVGLSGNVCGTLAATLFAAAVKYFEERNKPKHGLVRSNLQGMNIGTGWMDPLKDISKEFQRKAEGKHCGDIAGRKFQSPGDLTEFLEDGGCDPVFNVLEACLQVNPEGGDHETGLRT